MTLNTNTPTCLPPIQTQQPTSPDITTASADLHDCTSWQSIHSLTSGHLPLLTTLSIHHKTKTTRIHFTKTITNYQKADWKSFNPLSPTVADRQRNFSRSIFFYALAMQRCTPVYIIHRSFVYVSSQFCA